MSNGMLVLVGGLGVVAWIGLQFTDLWIHHELRGRRNPFDDPPRAMGKRLRAPVAIGVLLILVLVVVGWALR
ncbi:MAG: hypothetical protein IT368_14685 [Candidatus Hydrogenedentes bacterium]|nr:hypothetical protein [Candidatus Hydrogenedentota bacterium]